MFKPLMTQVSCQHRLGWCVDESLADVFKASELARPGTQSERADGQTDRQQNPNAMMIVSPQSSLSVVWGLLIIYQPANEALYFPSRAEREREGVEEPEFGMKGFLVSVYNFKQLGENQVNNKRWNFSLYHLTPQSNEWWELPAAHTERLTLPCCSVSVGIQ